MDSSFAIIFILVAIIGWGFGDFYIQRLVRKIGNWQTLFITTFFGAVILTPFVISDFNEIFSFENNTFMVLLGASLILFIGALLDFEALKKGKLAVVEPIWSLEIIASSILAYLIIGEKITFTQGMIIISLIIGLVLVSLRHYRFNKKIWLEKGVFLAVLAAIVMGCANFFIGFGSRASDGIIMNWFLNSFMALASLIFIVYNKRMRNMFKNVKKYNKSVIGMCIFDNAAWIGFAIAMTLAPIGITVALTESYIIIAVLLGVFINKEHLTRHQKVGMIIAIISAIILAGIT